MKIMVVGLTRAMKSESWYARLTMRSEPRPSSRQTVSAIATVLGSPAAGGSALISSNSIFTPRFAQAASAVVRISASALARVSIRASRRSISR